MLGYVKLRINVPGVYNTIQYDENTVGYRAQWWTIRIWGAGRPGVYLSEHWPRAPLHLL